MIVTESLRSSQVQRCFHVNENPIKYSRGGPIRFRKSSLVATVNERLTR